MENRERWKTHSRMSDPGNGVLCFDGLPSDVGALCGIVQGLLVHSDWIAAYGVSEEQFGSVSRETLPLAARLKQLAELDAGVLTVERTADKRAVGTCRDYALMLCGMLRQQGVAARVRCGFAAYFTRPWEDHWICEYRRDGRWMRADAQLDRIVASRLGIAFDLADLPEGMFVGADEAWRHCRSGHADPTTFGHGQEAVGLWFVRINVVRDHYSLNDRETSDWDTWRQAAAAYRVLSEAEIAEGDAIAACPQAPLAAMTPPWRT